MTDPSALETAALLPCPFCGADARQHYDFVSCSSCGISTATSTAEHSAAEWDARAALDAEPMEEVREIVETMLDRESDWGPTRGPVVLRALLVKLPTDGGT